MKKARKGIAFLLCALMIVLSVPAFAAADDDIKAAMNENITSADIVMNLEMGVQKMSNELKTVFGITTEELPLMSADYDMALKASEDQLIMQMAVTALVKATGIPDTSVEVYADMDLSDSENPKMQYITKTNGYDKYIVMNESDFPGYEQMLESLKAYTPEKMQEINKKLEEILPEKEFVLENDVYTMTFTEEELKKAAKDSMLVLEDVLLPIFVGTKDMISATEASDTAVTDEMRTQYQEQVEKWAEALDSVKLFAEDALVVSATLDDEKHLNTMDISMNLATNLNEVITAVSPLIETPQMDTENLTEEEKSVLEEQKKETDEFIASITKEISDVEASLKLSMEMSNVNGDVTVTFPTLTEENSISMKDFMIDDSKINVLYNGVRVQFDDVEPIIEGDRVLVPLRKFCNVIGISDENIGFENGVITIANGDTTMVLTINETAVTKTTGDQTETIELDVPATILNDRTLVPLRFVSENFGHLVTFTPIEGKTGSIITIVPGGAAGSSSSGPVDVDDTEDETATLAIDEKFTFPYAVWGADWAEIQSKCELEGEETTYSDGRASVQIDNLDFFGTPVTAVLLFDRADSETPGLYEIQLLFDDAEEEALLAAMEKVYGERKDYFLDKDGIENPLTPAGWTSPETLEKTLTEAQINLLKEQYPDIEQTRMDAIMRQPLVEILFDEEENRVVISGSTAVAALEVISSENQ